MKSDKKQIRTAVLVILFGSTLLLLGGHIYWDMWKLAGTAGRSSLESQGSIYAAIAQIDLGPVEVRNFQRMGFTRGFIKFSPDGSRLAVGAENGELLLVDSAGRVHWKRKLGVGKITALDFASDGRTLYVGESSPEGNLYCLEAGTGREKWRQASVKEIGADIRIKNYPSIVRIVSDRQGRVYAVAQRFGKSGAGIGEYYGKIYSFDQTGRLRWQFPADSNLDAWVNWISVDKQGDALAFGTANFETARDYRFGRNIYLLDGRSGEERWSADVTPVVPFNRTVMRGSPNLAEDGSYLAAMASDGRAFLYDSQGRQLWERVLSAPRQIAGVYLNAVGRDAYLAGQHAVFATINTYNNANWQLPTPVEHPSGNSVFIFNLAGKLTGKWQAGGSVEEMAFAGGRIAVAVGRNTKTRDAQVHGLYVLTLPEGLVEDRLASEGPCIAVAISSDGRYLAGIEAPIQKDNGQIIGRYRLLLWQRK